MALNPSPNYPPTGEGPYKIDRQWCMGDSLPFINENFKIFDDRTLALSSTFVKQISAGKNITVTPTLTSNIIAISNTIEPKIIQVQYNQNTGTPFSTVTLPSDKNVSPTGGIQILSKAITPILASNNIIRVSAYVTISNQVPAGGAGIVLFKGSTAIATAVLLTTQHVQNLSLLYYDTTPSAATYNVEMFTYSGGTAILNRDTYSFSRGGTLRTYLTLEEIRQ
jgi:hypothetical protein